MMHQPVENTAYCLNCTNQWPAVWDRRAIILACPECRWWFGVPKEFVSSGWWTDREQEKDMSDTNPEAGGKDSPLWSYILDRIGDGLRERRERKHFVEVRGESGSCLKEIGDLSASERQALEPSLAQQVAEQLLDRYLAGQGLVDLATKRRAYTKKIGALAPKDLPALVEADRQRAEAEREEAGLAQEVQEYLGQLLVAGSRRDD